MAELVAGAFLSPAIEALLKRLASGDILDFFGVKKLQDGFLLRKLEITLNSLNKIIEDAEERQYRDPYVKRWLDELRDAVFHAEDLLLEIATEASRRKLQLQLHPTTGKLRDYFTSIVNSFEKEIEPRIQKLVEYLECLAKQRDELGLKDGSGALTQGGVNRKFVKRLLESSLIDEADIFGRDADKEKLIKILLSPSKVGNRSSVDVIAITSMGGMGKTTLARLVYEDKRMKDEFQHRAWVCISEEFDPVQATKAILKSLDHSIKLEQSDALDPHQCKLMDRLKDKKFFVVLDDVWNKNNAIWEAFRMPFKYGAPGSKILTTTREQEVAKVMRSRDIHFLEPLQDEYPWKLFVNHAFSDQCVDPELELIGRRIVKKCGGLPLAIKTLGSLLGTKLAPQYWDTILKSDIWSLSEVESNIIPSLRLSYHYLPSTIKRCFAFCSIFPKDYLIEKDVLIQLWMAEGLLHSTHTNKSFEEMGNEIFNDLESRSFFEPSEKNGNCFMMHDLLNDLAKSVMGEFCVQLEVDQVREISIKSRYFSFIGKENENFEKVFKCHQLRSFIQLRTFYRYGMNDDIISRLSHLKYIRELSLNDCVGLMNLTNDICNLKHLHYLDLSNTSIQKLPNSMCLLINLQTLKLRGCRRLVEFPSHFHKLINLRHLDLEGCIGIQKMPKHMGKLNHLQTMNHFFVAREGGSGLKELGTLNCLMGSLTISRMECVNDPMDLREANLKEKHLDKINLSYELCGCSCEEEQHQEHILEGLLEPNNTIKELTVARYGGTKFPKWLGGSHFLPNLVSLTLSNCTKCVNLPPIGQLPSLEKLEIKKFHGIKVIGEEFYGNGSSNAPFRCLSYLCFNDMREWEEWNICWEDESFPCLQELHIGNCPRLTKSLPPHLPCLKNLDIKWCGKLETTLPKSSCMEKLYLWRCEKISIKDMPTCVLPSLHVLEFRDCLGMESLPRGGMLSNLQRLFISHCPKLIAFRRDWGLHELLSLKELSIGDEFGDMESFPEEGLLPSNLHSLSLRDCPNLRRINYEGLLHLHSLVSLHFINCPYLSFEDMPENGFPPSLIHLSISGYCPLLKERCEKEMGPDWPKIADIPHVSTRRY